MTPKAHTHNKSVRMRSSMWRSCAVSCPKNEGCDTEVSKAVSIFATRRRRSLLEASGLHAAARSLLVVAPSRSH